MTGSRFRLVAAGLLLAALALAPSPAAGQTDVTTGRIVGRIADQEGQPLAGATVEARNAATGLVLTGQADARGLYRLVNVPVGDWSVSATLQGSAKRTRSGVAVNVGSAVTVDFRLALGAAAEATVTAEAPAVETTQTATQAVVDAAAIQSLPIAGRNFTDFVLLTPNSQRETQRGNLSLSGQRGIATNVAVDGVDFTNAFFGGTTGAAEGRAPIAISQESVREF